jgi:hypothetical protein
VRAVDCWCGQIVQAEDNERLVRALGEHVREEHPDEGYGEAQVRERAAQQAYEPPTGDPPWAY